MNFSGTEYLKKTFKVVCAFALFMICIRTFVIEPGRVNGRSMENTLYDNDIFIVNKFALLLREPKRGDIVHIHDPITKQMLVKRIVGLPGERIQISQNAVHLIDTNGNEQLLTEDYLKPDTITRPSNEGSTLYDAIQPDEYFVMGDNRTLSIDSRNYGPVHRSTILGLVIMPSFLKK